MLLFCFRAAERAGALLRLFDADGDGYLSFDEFRGTYQRLLSTSGILGVTRRCFYLKPISVTIAITLYVATAARQCRTLAGVAYSTTRFSPDDTVVDKRSISNQSKACGNLKTDDETSLRPVKHRTTAQPGDTPFGFDAQHAIEQPALRSALPDLYSQLKCTTLFLNSSAPLCFNRVRCFASR